MTLHPQKLVGVAVVVGTGSIVVALSIDTAGGAVDDSKMNVHCQYSAHFVEAAADSIQHDRQHC
jgi:hypothetical protein